MVARKLQSASLHFTSYVTVPYHTRLHMIHGKRHEDIPQSNSKVLRAEEFGVLNDYAGNGHCFVETRCSTATTSQVSRTLNWQTNFGHQLCTRRTHSSLNFGHCRAQFAVSIYEMALQHPREVLPADAPPGVPAGPAVAPAAGLAGAAALGRPTTCRELLNDESNSPPAHERLANYLRGYCFEGVAPIPTPAALRDQTVTLSDRKPMTFLSLVSGLGGVPEVTVLHRLM